MFVTQVKFCGHILEAGTRRAMPSKLSSVKKYHHEKIRTTTKLNGFLGLTGWYAIYIHKYAEMAAPLMEALKDENLTLKRIT